MVMRHNHNTGNMGHTGSMDSLSSPIIPLTQTIRIRNSPTLAIPIRSNLTRRNRIHRNRIHRKRIHRKRIILGQWRHQRAVWRLLA